MASPRFILALLFVVSVSLGSLIEPWFQDWNGGRNDSTHILTLLMGDSRRMLANHFFAKADAYFHSGYYPTIFDPQNREEESHMGEEHAEESSEEHVHDENCKHEKEVEGGFLGAPKDWIDRFSRNFFPSQHSHLEKGGERELLPWMRLAADLDPYNIDTYTMAAYWLRSRLGKVDEAERFLREGLRANPTSYEIYFELGRIYSEDKHEPTMAGNLWELALKKWQALEKAGVKPDDLVYMEIVGHLAKLEEDRGNLKQAVTYLKMLKEKSPHPGYIQEQIEQIEGKISEMNQK